MDKRNKQLLIIHEDSTQKRKEIDVEAIIKKAKADKEARIEFGYDEPSRDFEKESKNEKIKTRKIGEVLRIARIANDLSILEASKISGVSNPYIVEIEKNKKNPSDEILEKLLKTYNLYPKQFVKLEDYYSRLDTVEDSRKYRMCLSRMLKVIDTNYMRKDK